MKVSSRIRQNVWNVTYRIHDHVKRQKMIMSGIVTIHTDLSCPHGKGRAGNKKSECLSPQSHPPRINAFDMDFFG
jgi:hypothetical protein